MKLAEVNNVHFIGIGGIGMSALARFMHLRGKVVTGYDRTRTKLTDALEAEGMKIVFDPDPSRLKGVDLVIYTPAVPTGHSELAEAERRNIPVMKRAEVLGMISREYRSIAIAGTHGKTTTTGLTAYLLRAGGIDTTAFIGGISQNFNSNFVFGESEWVVVEADEFDRSFLQLQPDVAVITSIDPDHLDIYGTKASLMDGFRDFANQILSGGTLYLCDRVEQLEPKAVNTYTYGMENGEIRASDVAFGESGTSFTYQSSDHFIENLTIPFPGRFNLENALAAISVAKLLGVGDDELRRALAAAKGVHRRFEVCYDEDELRVVDDYAHHPEEIRAVLEAVRSQFGFNRKIIAIFQPHLYSRTRDFYQSFGEALSIADAVLLVDIYPAREEPIEGVSSDLIFNHVKVAQKRRCRLEEVTSALAGFKSSPAVVMVMGAGNIDTQVEAIVNEVKTWSNEP